MNAALVVDGRSSSLTPHELKAAAKAILDCRRGGKMQRRDLAAYEWSRKGLSDAMIGKMLGITARSVKAGIERVRNGRYGDIGGD